MFELDTFQERLDAYVRLKGVRPEAFRVLAQVAMLGQVARGEVSAITGLRERTARDLLAALLADGILASDTPNGPVCLRVSLSSAETRFPALFATL